MKREKTEAERQLREHALWYTVLKYGIPLFALVLSSLIVLLCAVYGKVRPVITIELGEDTPEASAFVRTDAGDALYRTEPELQYRKAGNYRLTVLTGKINAPVLLRVKDTTAPTANAAETTVPANRTLTPDKLIRDLRDRSIVKITFETAPEFGTIGDYEAVVLLEDASGNKTRVTVPVHVRAAVYAVTCEAGCIGRLDVDEYEEGRGLAVAEVKPSKKDENRLKATVFVF